MTTSSNSQRRQLGVLNSDVITLSHGSGGKAMRDLIEDVFVRAFDNEKLSHMEDQARIELSELQAKGDRLAFTTDSYVIFPTFFPGGDIGKLAVSGTVNDLAVSGAKPLYMTCSMILEEGFSVADLRKIVQSMKQTADRAGVAIVTGDTKVVEKGSADKVFINTAGIGVIDSRFNVSSSNAQPGDLVIVNGPLGDHGAAVIAARQDLAFETNVLSDCAPLNLLIADMFEACQDIHCLRDATRGGVATILNEFVRDSKVGIKLSEKAISIRPEVRGICEILGLDPLYLANEGKIVSIVPPAYAGKIIDVMRRHEEGASCSIIGEVVESSSHMVTMETSFGGERVVDMLVGDQLPRIC